MKEKKKRNIVSAKTACCYIACTKRNVSATLGEQVLNSEVRSVKCKKAATTMQKGCTKEKATVKTVIGDFIVLL